MGREGRARTVVCKDICFEEGDRVFETGNFLHRVDSAGIPMFRGVSGEEKSGTGRQTDRRGGGGRTRGLWHPGSRVQWCLVGCKEGKAAKLGDEPLRTQLEQGRFLVVVRTTVEDKGRAGRTCRI